MGEQNQLQPSQAIIKTPPPLPVPEPVLNSSVVVPTGQKELPPQVAEQKENLKVERTLPVQNVPKKKEIKTQEMEEKPEKEKIVRKSKGLGIGCSCRVAGCGSLFLFIAIIVGVILLFATRPTWFKNYLNVELEAPTYDGTTVDSAFSRIALQFEDFGIGENNLRVTQGQAQAILSDQFGESLLLDLQFNNLKIFTDIDGGDVPLWLVLDLEFDKQNNPRFRKIGTERIGLPSFLNDVLSEVVLSLAGVVTKEDKGFLESILNLPDNVKIKNVRVLSDEIIVTLDVSTGLDNLFPR